MHEALTDVSHLPVPPPARAWSITMRWEELLFLHWRAPAELLQRHLPPGLTIDSYDGSAWLGVARRGAVPDGGDPVPAAAADPWLAHVPGVEPAHLRAPRRARRRVVLQPRCRQSARGRRRAVVVRAALLRRAHAVPAAGRNRALPARTARSARAGGGIRRRLARGRCAPAVAAGHARALPDRTLLPVRAAARPAAARRHRAPTVAGGARRGGAGGVRHDPLARAAAGWVAGLGAGGATTRGRGVVAGAAAQCALPCALAGRRLRLGAGAGSAGVPRAAGSDGRRRAAARAAHPRSRAACAAQGREMGRRGRRGRRRRR
ncbi:MAG: DUF2071 domain-containing protein, partial [Phycisphaerales bacterium]|nr:DUF2071 domain-containing protein [Phycisphaerales bacterium]